MLSQSPSSVKSVYIQENIFLTIYIAYVPKKKSNKGMEPILIHDFFYKQLYIHTRFWKNNQLQCWKNVNINNYIKLPESDVEDEYGDRDIDVSENRNMFDLLF